MVDAVDADLRPVLRRGGRLLMYHGWDDAAIPASQRRRKKKKPGIDPGLFSLTPNPSLEGRGTCRAYSPTIFSICAAVTG